jgi:lipoprotein-anchoring transpeptidase ErfK/SrfK
MFRKMILLSAVASVAISSAALASVAAGDRGPTSKPMAGTQLAQSGEIDIYYDKHGRQVLVDSLTGEVISTEPRRLTRQEWRRQQRERHLDRQRGFDDGFPVDEGYEDGVVFERERPRRYEEFPEVNIDEFPQAPEGEETGVVRQQPVERRALGEAPAREPSTGSTPPASTETETAAVEPEDGVGEIIQDNSSDHGAGAISPFGSASKPEVAALQVLLDRRGASPGVIDGRFGSNVDKAIVAYRELTGENLKSTDTEAIKAALAASGGDPFADYQITPEDAAGPYVASVPEDYGQKAKLERLSFTSVTEMLAERFHMDEAYLKALNPEANFNRPGTIVKVANFGRLVSTPVARIVADKSRKQVRGYGEDGKLVAAYPATIGSSDTPSPTGNHAVSRIAFNPNYTYNPKINFKQGDNTQVLTIPPGPNGPVGSIWIALDKPTYGIHGTPEPSKIGKTESHGCVRLTNFDANELAKLVKPGVMVEFVE